ncbi:MAG TPA: sortase [Caldilineales bacterium]|nr:sortase [Caldilineales bacterium]
MSGRLTSATFWLLWMAVTLSACSGAVTPTSPASLTAAPPTWTPTHIPSPRPLLNPTPSPTPPPIPDPTLIPAPEPAPFSPRPSAPPMRVDAEGPATIPTIAPLPPGQGRSPVRLIIPALGMDVRVQPMGWHATSDAQGVRTEWDVPDSAAGRHIDSAFPGELGNVVISGHNNIGDAVFAPLSSVGERDMPLKLGDPMILEDELGRRFVYRVTGWRRFPEARASVAKRNENASYLLPTDFPQLTLITCWPPENNTHRVIITGALTEIRTP